MIPTPRGEDLVTVVLVIGHVITLVVATALAQGIDRTFFPHP